MWEIKDFEIVDDDKFLYETALKYRKCLDCGQEQIRDRKWGG